MKITTLANPRQVILVSLRYREKDNIIALSWHSPLSFDPPLYAISIGKTRFSLNLIRKSKVFVINFMPYKLKEKIWLCGSKTGSEIDKFKEAKFGKIESEKINCPKIKEALGWLECRTVDEIEVGDHILFIGRVVNSLLKKKGKRPFHLFANKFTTTEK